MLRVTSFVHLFINNTLTKPSTILDLTLGNGNDALFCLQRGHRILGLDIQNLAIKRSKEKCRDYSNYVFHQIDHALLDTVIHESFDAILMNNGYLPNGDEHITTSLDSSLIALAKSIEMMRPLAYLIVTLYRKQVGGLLEAEGIEAYLKQNKKLRFDQSYTYTNDDIAPLVLIFQKVDEGS
jgi:methylase of polypeptide subunit release factors